MNATVSPQTAILRASMPMLLAAALLSLSVGAASAAATREPTGPTPAPAAKDSADVPESEAEPDSDAWRIARALADSGAFDSSLAVIQRALADGAPEFALRWLAAGITGEAGRHGEAVRLYERLSADFSGQSDELWADLADQRLWSGRPADAVQDYRRWLELHPEDRDARRRLATAQAHADSLLSALDTYDVLLASDPSDTESALGRALVIGWRGRHAAAVRAYRDVLARDPENRDARQGIAVNENLSGLHRRAAARFDTLLQESGADHELYKSLAFARYWDDDPDAARRALDHFLEGAPDDAEGAELALRLAREHRPSMRLGHGRTDDSDGQRLTTPTVEFTWPLTSGTTAMVGWRRDHTLESGDSRKLARYSAGLRRRFTPQWSAYANYAYLAWGDRVGAAACGDAGVVFRPVDRLRLEAVVEREPVFTRLSLQDGITLLNWAGSLDFSASERLALHVDGRAGYFSDQNRSERVAASVLYQAWPQRELEASLGIRLEQLNTHQDLDHGYYDPDFHREWGPSLALEWTPNARWTLAGDMRTGWQRDKGDVSEPFYGASGQLEFALDAWWGVALEGGRGDSNLISAGGYQRRWWQLSVSRGF